MVNTGGLPLIAQWSILYLQSRRTSSTPMRVTSSKIMRLTCSTHGSDVLNCLPVYLIFSLLHCVQYVCKEPPHFWGLLINNYIFTRSIKNACESSLVVLFKGTLQRYFNSVLHIYRYAYIWIWTASGFTVFPSPHYFIWDMVFVLWLGRDPFGKMIFFRKFL